MHLWCLRFVRGPSRSNAANQGRQLVPGPPDSEENRYQFLFLCDKVAVRALEFLLLLFCRPGDDVRGRHRSNRIQIACPDWAIERQSPLMLLAAARLTQAEGGLHHRTGSRVTTPHAGRQIVQIRDRDRHARRSRDICASADDLVRVAMTAAAITHRILPKIGDRRLAAK